MNGRAMLYRIEWRLMQWWGAALCMQDAMCCDPMPAYYRSVRSVIVLAKATEHVRRIRFALSGRSTLCGMQNSTAWRHGNEQREIQGTTEKS